ncbi:MAG: peptidylprolyl isomerase [Candidatus Adiutrix sp.]|jgi:parvulin-like peptidyl-prolyl isomerase|nr:peptidylprolyl isomerase [Candidatus Adiutrix sp.]
MRTKILPLLFMLLALTACDSGSQPTASESAAPAAETAAAAAPPAGDPAAAPAAPPAAALPEEIDLPVVATVNGAPISGRTLAGQVVMAESGQLALGEDDARSEEERRAARLEMKVEVLNGLINLELACQEALRRGYAPGEAELDEALRVFQSDLGNSVEEIRQTLEQFGETEEALRGQLARNLAFQKWQENDFLSQITVTDQEARAFYDEHPQLVQHGDLVRVSQVFIGVPLGVLENVKAQARARAEEALQRVKTGDDFGLVAAEMSNDPEAAATNGDLGWLGKGQYLPMFEETFFSLEPGQVSEIIESPMGFHIFKITGTRPAGQESFENMKVDIVEFLSGGKLAEAMRVKMIELREAADIQILDPALQKAFAEYESAEQ